MNEIKFFDSLSYVDDSLISEAISYKPIKYKFCRTAVVLVFLSAILISLWFVNSENNSLTLSLKVYGESRTTEMKIGEKIPVDIFETTTGAKGFVFSYDKTDENVPTAVAIVSEGDYDGIEKEILEMADDGTQNYIFYVADENKGFPYMQNFIIEDFRTGEKYNFTVSIIKEKDKYFVQLESKSDV